MKKRITLIVLSLMLLLFACACGGGKAEEPDVTADYESPRDAILAHKAGTNVTGKTIKVKVYQDDAGGIVYYAADTKVNGNVYVTIITDDSNRDEVCALKKGDVVVVKVDSIDDHIKYSFYVYAKEYKKY